MGRTGRLGDGVEQIHEKKEEKKRKEKAGITAQRKGLVKQAAVFSYTSKERASSRPGKACVAVSQQTVS